MDAYLWIKHDFLGRDHKRSQLIELLPQTPNYGSHHSQYIMNTNSWVHEFCNPFLHLMWSEKFVGVARYYEHPLENHEIHIL
jgi:hypothetical protein